MKAIVKIEDSVGTRQSVKTFRNAEDVQRHRLALKNRVEAGATVTVTKV
jgi:hypothetical protein